MVEANDLAEAESHLAAMIDPPARLWRKLGETALVHQANRQAMEAFERAIRIEEEQATEVALRLELVIRAAEAAQRCGSSAVFDRQIRRAIDLADQVDAPEALARVLALRTDPGFAADDVWLGHFDRAWSDLGDARSTVAVELLRAQVYATYLSDPEQSSSMATDALAMAGDVDEPMAWSAAYDAMRLVAVRSDTPTQLAEIGAQLVHLGRGGDLDALARGYDAIIFAALLTGDTSAIGRYVAAYAAHAERTRHPHHRVMLAGARTLLAIARGELETARFLGTEALTEALTIGNSLGIQIAMAQQAMIAIEADEATTALPVGTEQIDTSPLVRWWRLGQLLRASRYGHDTEAADLLGELLPDEGALDHWRFVWLGELVVLTDAAVLTGDRERAQLLAAELRPYSDRFATLSTTVHLGSVWRPIAGVAALLGDAEAADRAYRRAEEADRRMGVLLCLSRSRIEHARLLANTGRRAEAATLIDLALDTTERLGLKRLTADAHAVQAEAGLDHLSIEVPGLSDRETELLMAVAKGRSNRELAAQFHVSIKTVERHLSNIYAKLGVTGRNEAVQVALSSRGG
ncbi:MAG: LuxR C-terminal-related transcriptional regulator [Actinomycetota bacterium]